MVPRSLYFPLSCLFHFFLCLSLSQIGTTTCRRLAHILQAYLSAAVEYIQGGDAEDGLSIEDIKGIWVASDDPSAVEEVRAVAPMYLPNVDNSSIVCVSGGVEGGPDQDGVQTYSSHQVNSLCRVCLPTLVFVRR